MKTTKDIAEILKPLNSEGKYDAIIHRAELNGYHDFKHDAIQGHPEYGECPCPKVQLVADLSAFPELKHIELDVINGVYDESPDAEDTERMRNDLIDDGASDEFMKVMKFKVPTYSERVKRRLNNN